MAQRRLLERLRRSLEQTSAIGSSSRIIQDSGPGFRRYHAAPPSFTSQTVGLNQAAGANQEQTPAVNKKERPILTNFSSRWKFKLAADRLLKAAAAKDAQSDTAAAADDDQSDVTSISITPPTYVKSKQLRKTASFIMEILNKEAVAEVRKEREIPELRPGYVVRLKVEVPENKRRVLEYKGIIIAMRKNGIHTTFRIRRQVGSTYVENVLPLYSPLIKEFEILDKKKVRRAKLYYLRDGQHRLKSIKRKASRQTPKSDKKPPIEFQMPPPPPKA